MIDEVSTQFEPANNVCEAGVIFTLPALLSQGLLKGETIYKKLKKGYYGLVHILLLLAYMALSRIKNPEQLRSHKPGEFGKILGLDRVPEVRCLRGKLSQIASMNKARDLSNALADYWIEQDNQTGGYFYVDGHVRVYHGYKSNRPKCHVSRQKLCLPATIDWWVNDWMGKPYFFVTGEVNEKLLEVLENEIIPQLINDLNASASEEDMKANELLPRFTLIFDREGYSPKKWKEWWKKYRIAVVSYRKNVKDKWDEKKFEEKDVIVAGKKQKMKLAEKIVEIEGLKLREIRKLSDSGKQTALYSSNFILSIEELGGKMFSRWSQENFFRYMMCDYDIDHLIEYAQQRLDEDIKVVNPSYRECTKKLEKTRIKIKAKRAKFMKLCDDNFSNDLKQTAKQIADKARLHEEIEDLKVLEQEQIAERKKHKQHITIIEMPEPERYTKLDTDKKLFVECIKMIAYRAETSVVNLLSEHYTKSLTEGRTLVKEIIKSDADLIPDYENKTLTVRLHSLSTPRSNYAVKKICKTLNETETIYPTTDLKIIYKSVLC